MKRVVKTRAGFTIIEAIITTGVIAVIGLSIMTAFAGAYKSVDLAQSGTAAVALANEKIEIIRNMPYDDLGTENGWPPGNIPDDETMVRGMRNLTVHTMITYVDDPFDGNAEGTIEGKPTDIYPYDYKRVEVTVRKAGNTSILAKLTTNVAAKAAETETNTGIIKICVFDSNGDPVGGADVSIVNDDVIPPVSIANLVTDAVSGCVMVPKLPPDSHNHYHLTVTMDGFSTDMTYPRTAQNPNALQPDIDVIAQQVQTQNFFIDRLSTMNFQFVDQSGDPIGPITFTLTGSKITYFNPDTPKYSVSHTTNAAGYISIPNMEYDDYNITNVVSPYNVIASSPGQPMHLDANTTLNATVYIATSASNPVILNYSPESGKVGTTVTVTVNGRNIQNGATMKIYRVINEETGETEEIAATDVDIAPHELISGNFNLAGATVGKWNLRIDTGGEFVIQLDGFEVIP